MPETLRLSPMLAVPAARLPASGEYAFEFKWDGMRALVHCDAGTTRVVSRNGNDVTNAFPELHAIAAHLGRQAVLDGEVVAMDERGHPDFGLLQRRMGLVRPDDARIRMGTHPVHFLAFDLLYLDGKPIMTKSLTERRKALEGLAFNGPAWGTSPAHVGAGPAMLAVSRSLGLEGIMAKRVSSRYAAGVRSPAWLKIRNRARQEFVVGGWSEGEGSRRETFGALLVGHYAAPGAPRLVYDGRVGSGFRGPEAQSLLRNLEALTRVGSPFDAGADDEDSRVHWVEPLLVAEVEFSGLTQHGALRQPSFKGLRADKAASEVVWEQAEQAGHAEVSLRRAPSGAGRSASAS